MSRWRTADAPAQLGCDPAADAGPARRRDLQRALRSAAPGASSSSGGMRSRSWPSRSWSSGTGRWCWASAAASWRPARRRGRLPGDVPRAGPQGPFDPRRGLAGRWLFGVATRVATHARATRCVAGHRERARASIGSRPRGLTTAQSDIDRAEIQAIIARRSPGCPPASRPPFSSATWRARATRRRPGGWAGRSGPSRAGCRGHGPASASG